MRKFCTRPVVLTISWPFCKVTKLRICCTLYHERRSLCGHHDSLTRLTLAFNHGFNSNDDVFVRKTYCFDIDLSLMLWKVTNNFILSPFYNGYATNAGGFDSVGVTLFVFYADYFLRVYWHPRAHCQLRQWKILYIISMYHLFHVK